MTWKCLELEKEDIKQLGIDPHIVSLIIKMNRLPFLETTWSCGGHFSAYEGNCCLNCVLYHRGIMFAIEKGNEEGKQFIEDLKNFLKNYPFTHIELLPKHMWFPHKSHPKYLLRVDWIKRPDLRDINKRKEIEEFMERMFNETYGRLNADLEIFVDKRLSASKNKNAINS